MQHQQLNPEEWLGRRLGRYEITGVLGTGGKGLVFRAHDTSIERDVAIKVLTDQLLTDETERSRFISEAKSAGKVKHTNTVTVHEIAQEGAFWYIVMEVVAGGSANDRLARGQAYDPADATRMAIEASLGLSAAHQQGFVHRDINPSNLLLTDDGRVKVSDFRLAKKTTSTTTTTLQNLTLAGQLIGTPYYMSPEQCEGEKVDARGDIYSLGATYFALLAGQPPFADLSSDLQIMVAHSSYERPSPVAVNPDVPDACAQIIEQAMAIDPDQRYQTMEEMRGDLEAVHEALAAGYV